MKKSIVPWILPGRTTRRALRLNVLLASELRKLGPQSDGHS
jgi:hypothetical protein